jgi:hypothetical protein
MFSLNSKPRILDGSDLDDAPDGEWKKNLTQVIRSLADGEVSLDTFGLAESVGSVTIVKQVSIPDEWVQLALKAGWVNWNNNNASSLSFENAAIRKSDDGFVETVGFIQSKSTAAAFSTVLDLSEQSYPPRMTYNSILPITRMFREVPTDNTGRTSERMDISPDGSFLYSQAVAVGDAITIATRWTAADRSPPTRIDAPILLSYDFQGKRCGDVRAVTTVNVSNQQVALPEPRLAWTDRGNGTVAITNILGLPSNQKYNIAFRLTPE